MIVSMVDFRACGHIHGSLHTHIYIGINYMGLEIGSLHVCYTFEGRKEGSVLFNDTLNTFYLWLYGVKHGNGPLR